MKIRSVCCAVCAGAFFLLLTLKLCGVIRGSWWLVTAPLWAPLAVVVLIAIVVFLVYLSDDNTQG